jgi:hypothetical protein
MLNVLSQIGRGFVAAPQGAREKSGRSFMEKIDKYGKVNRLIDNAKTQQCVKITTLPSSWS